MAGFGGEGGGEGRRSLASVHGGRPTALPLPLPLAPPQVDPQLNLVYVQGQVPGHKGNFVLVKDAVKMDLRQPPRPLPTHLGELPPVSVAPKAGVDPFDYKEG